MRHPVVVIIEFNNQLLNSITNHNFMLKMKPYSSIAPDFFKTILKIPLPEILFLFLYIIFPIVFGGPPDSDFSKVKIFWTLFFSQSDYLLWWKTMKILCKKLSTSWKFQKIVYFFIFKHNIPSWFPVSPRKWFLKNRDCFFSQIQL